MSQSEPTEKKLLRNNSKHPLTLNGRRRHGQYEWHNAECQIEDYGIQREGFGEDSRPYRLIWCATHGQWASERPKTVVYTFEDGTEIKRNA